ncbi:hypothetical protein [Rhodoferax sp. GW822-FHT02A01]|uniref:hypothetical protein n=1 Tax=Rhodoferax sp. GW822-FHT02A01 TaxID=3141537 RepID=UPI00315DCCF4
MIRQTMVAWILVTGFPALQAQAEDRVVSIGESPFSAEADANGGHGRLVDLIRALDRATHSSTKIVLRPFARSLEETAAGHADFHIPLIQNGDSSAPPGLAYVTEVNFGQVPFVIYSHQRAPLDASSVVSAKKIEIEPGHESFFSFPVKVTHCVPCTLDKILLGRTDAMIVSADIVDPLLSNPKYKGIHRALYKVYPVRALVPIKSDSSETRRYLIEGMEQLHKTGEFWKVTGRNHQYLDWQP